ncbi:MAG: DNA translocase FtsK 4TM domain-containing protein, partial [Magnetococcales bacterium]|nr:DNA translocase FtsK 4TM domain-containing protein [Magnetococcales bacterium]
MEWFFVAAGNQYKARKVEIATRRVSLVREILGLVVLTLSAFSALCLLSYHGSDPSFNHAGHSTVRNLGGLAGAYLSDLLLQLLGLAAVWVPILGMAQGVRMLRRSTMGVPLWDRLLATPVLVGSCAILLRDHFGPLRELLPAGAGGVAGKLGGELMRRNFGGPGGSLLLLVLALLALMVITRFSFVDFFESLRLWFEGRDLTREPEPNRATRSSQPSLSPGALENVKLRLMLGWQTLLGWRTRLQERRKRDEERQRRQQSQPAFHQRPEPVIIDSPMDDLPPRKERVEPMMEEEKSAPPAQRRKKATPSADPLPPEPALDAPRTSSPEEAADDFRIDPQARAGRSA